MFSTKQTSGLGLAVVHSIVKRHDGLIIFESEINKGTTFTVFLPASKISNIPEKSGGYSIKGSGRILIMDDDAQIRAILIKMGKQLGYNVDLVPDGETVVERYKQAKISGDPYRAVIMDLTVPGRMGGEGVSDFLCKQPF